MRALTYLICLLSMFVYQPGQTAVPTSISYQAYLTDTDGSPVQGNTVVTFSIYNVEFGGVALWSDCGAR